MNTSLVEKIEDHLRTPSFHDLPEGVLWVALPNDERFPTQTASGSTYGDVVEMLANLARGARTMWLADMKTRFVEIDGEIMIQVYCYYAVAK